MKLSKKIVAIVLTITMMMSLASCKENKIYEGNIVEITDEINKITTGKQEIIMGIELENINQQIYSIEEAEMLGIDPEKLNIQVKLASESVDLNEEKSTDTKIGMFTSINGNDFEKLTTLIVKDNQMYINVLEIKEEFLKTQMASYITETAGITIEELGVLLKMVMPKDAEYISEPYEDDYELSDKGEDANAMLELEKKMLTQLIEQLKKLESDVFYNEDGASVMTVNNENIVLFNKAMAQVLENNKKEINDFSFAKASAQLEIFGENSPEILDEQKVIIADNLNEIIEKLNNYSMDGVEESQKVLVEIKSKLTGMEEDKNREGTVESTIEYEDESVGKVKIHINVSRTELNKVNITAPKNALDTSDYEDYEDYENEPVEL